MAINPQKLALDAVCQSHTGHMNGLWFLPARPLRPNNNLWMNLKQLITSTLSEDTCLLQVNIGWQKIKGGTLFTIEDKIQPETQVWGTPNNLSADGDDTVTWLRHILMERPFGLEDGRSKLQEVKRSRYTKLPQLCDNLNKHRVSEGL